MFVHCVFFWLREDLSAAEHDRFLEGVRSLLDIATVEHGHAGPPADTDRPIIDRSYSYGLVVSFADREAHDAYQVDPIHDRFRDECGGLWRDVKIYDVLTVDG